MEMHAAERKHEKELLSGAYKAETRKIDQEIKLLEAKAKFEERVSGVDPHRSMTRRVLTYMFATTVLFILPGMVLLGIDFQWFEINTWTQLNKDGFLGFFRSESQITEVVNAVGLPLVWLFSVLDLIAVIVGFYFGGSAAKFSNPYTKR